MHAMAKVIEQVLSILKITICRRQSFSNWGLSSGYSSDTFTSFTTFTHLKPGDIRMPFPAGGSGFTCTGGRRFFFGGVTGGTSGAASSSQSGT
jgi:hypothetical protein